MRALILICLWPLAAGAQAPQVICVLGPNAASYKPSDDQRPTSDTMQLAMRVNAAEKTICASNCPEIALLRNQTAANVELIADSGQAKLVYAPQFFAAVYSTFGDPGILAIIAHEAGHALDDTMGAAWISAKWPPEVRADAWAGCLLAKSSLNAADLHSALAALEKHPSPAHPGWISRLPAIRAGYAHCGGAPANFDKLK
jgi:hypothetical protein